MASYSRRDGLFGVQIITGPQSVLLRLRLGDERVEDFEVSAETTAGFFRDPSPETVRARVLEGTDTANREFGTNHHPWLARYVVEAYSDECWILRGAAHRVVKRLAEKGDRGYEGTD